MEKYVYFYETIIGSVGIAANEEYITNLYFGKTPDKNLPIKETELIKNAFAELKEYLEGKRKKFELPLKAEGTDFQKMVWNALLNIPYGETKSYQDIAIEIGNPKACRAVGLANNRNPIAIFIPCHRVIGKNGKLVGYGGGIHNKEILLNLEKESADC
ncbi:MAG: methylated-DNA--[protein]-cysteine S-methyltransferase [Fusobacteriaceae bacterium]|nr:methylated-DNA--[protein]-cysteine S-methyltransferase [Fusobacteriaceae bacterium]